MPRPRPAPRDAPQTLSFTVPAHMADAIRAEIPTTYGAQSAWFRRVYAHWSNTGGLRAELERERGMRIRVEQALRKVQVAVHGL